MVFSIVLRYLVLHHACLAFPLNESLYSQAWNRRFDIEYDKIWMRFGGLLAGVTGAYFNTFFVSQLRAFFTRTRLAATLTSTAFVTITVTAFINTGSRSGYSFLTLRAGFGSPPITTSSLSLPCFSSSPRSMLLRLRRPAAALPVMEGLLSHRTALPIPPI